MTTGRRVLFQHGFQLHQRVRYIPHHAHGNAKHPDCENGTVSRFGSDGVFVKFDRHIRLHGFDAASPMLCRAGDLVAIERL